jgi:copper chaperone
MKFEVTDMSCSGCANAIARAVKAVDPQATVEINVATKIVQIDSVIEPGKLVGTMEAAGFHPALLSS